jgi:hypothetical protein
LVYVDYIIDWGELATEKGLKWTKWCHLIADTHEELMDMAGKLKLKPEWIQKPGTREEHFDLIPTKRTLAIKYGALPISNRELALKTYGMDDGLHRDSF